jgi:hypothetical protein
MSSLEFWRKVAFSLTIVTIVLGAISLFLTLKNRPPKPSELENYLRDKNVFLEKQQDSLFSIIKQQNHQLSEKDKLLKTLANRKQEVEIFYYEKYKKIDGYFVRQITNEFDSIFSKAHVN